MDSRYHDLFASEVAKRSLDDLVGYLLDAAPTYARVVMNDPLLHAKHICDNIGIPPGYDADEDNSDEPPRVTPFKCGFCKCKRVCVVDELAALVCMQCGQQGNAGFEHGHRPPNDIRYVDPGYVPVRYLLKNILHLEGQGYPNIDICTMQDILLNIIEHKRCISEICPNVVYDALKRLKLGKLYPHRWYIAHQLNPPYQPLALSHADLERLVAIFKSCYERFARQVQKTSRKKKFFHYLMFIEQALCYLVLLVLDIISAS